MANVREIFPILADSATGAGEPAISRTEGEAAASQAGLIGFSFKDASGNVVLPSLTSDGKISVDAEEYGGTCKADYGSHAGSLSVQDIATLDESKISVTELYEKFELLVSSLHATLWQVVYIDDANGTPAETTLLEFVTAAGAYHLTGWLKCLQQDTTGGTGDQNIVLRGTNLVIASSMYGFLACQERAAS